MAPPPEDQALDRLSRAIDLHHRFLAGAEGTDAGAFLHAHEELRDLLAPMLDIAPTLAGAPEQSLGDYRLIRVLGRGAHGVVFEAEQVTLGRRVAVKVLHATAMDPRAVARFKREAQLAAGLDHPAITKVFVVSQQGAQHYLVMQLVRGASLAAVLDALRVRAARPSAPGLRAAVEMLLPADGAADTAAGDPGRAGYVHAALRVGVDIARALAHAHQRGVLHRDVKPGNILLRADGSAVLTDFGLARGIGAVGITLSGDFAGTPSYASPEQLAGDTAAVDACSDVFSLAATLYEMLTLRKAFPASTAAGMRGALASCDPTPPSQLNAEVPAGLDAVILRALAKDREARQPSAAVLADELDRWRAAGEVGGARPAAASGPPRKDDGSLHPGGRIGEFHLLERLGEGGMGIVYLAEQRHPVRRRVALKVIKLGMDTRAVLARFEAERQALAMMNHPNITRVLEGGATVDGKPYFVMEYVQGVPITRYCDQHALAIDERLALFRQVCSGVQHAHTKGVIHRDLTPNNILVSAQERKATAKIIDFGLARATDQRLTEHTLFTERGVFLGTPEYMSPEQAGLDGLDIDMRSDVYTLGVLLYELLTGRLPFESAALRAAGYEGMRKLIREQEPPRPSACVLTAASESAAAAGRRRTDAKQLARRLRGDLDWIVMRCLEKDRTRRYETASSLAEDVQRHLDDEPVTARAPRLGYRLRKLARRHRGELAAVAAVLLALVGGLVASTFFWLDARAHGKTASAALAVASRRQSEFDQLAAVEQLEQAIAAEQGLYPARPAQAPAMHSWLNDVAKPLLAKRLDVESALEALRGRASGKLVPTGPDRTHPRYLEYCRLQAKVRALASARDARLGVPLPLPSLPPAEVSLTALEAHELARPRLTPDERRRLWGEEPHGLALALHAASAADRLPPHQALRIAQTLAWGLFANGRDDDALRHMTALVEDAPASAESDVRTQLELLRSKIEGAKDGSADAELAMLRSQETALAAELVGQPRCVFSDPADQFLYETLTGVASALGNFASGAVKSVERRLLWAERITAGTTRHPGWQRAADAIRRADGKVASTLYRNTPIDLHPQTGLVPIGMNPVTKLWEFYDLRSALAPDTAVEPAAIPVPAHDSVSGHIEVTEATGIVLVLLPGGTFIMGAERTDESLPTYDSLAVDNEVPPHAVALAPFFMARHEVTQAQWRRLADGAEPSSWSAGMMAGPQIATWTNPVETVSWNDADRWLSRAGLALPTEAQWEYACRGGTATRWWTGNERETLAGAVNLADGYAHMHGATWNTIADWPDFQDGYCGHAPVDALRSNPFGLHHVHGNVFEWCRDWYGDYAHATAAGDGVRAIPDGLGRRKVFRGGAFNYPVAAARVSGIRYHERPQGSIDNVGLRAARPLQ